MKAKQTMGKLNLLVLVLACAVTVSPTALGVDLEIMPVDDFEPSGQPGGPFTPSSKDYQLTNVGPNSLWWGAYKTVDWLDVAPDWGPLGPSQSTIVTVSLNSGADALEEGVYLDTLMFYDITNDEQQSRGVTLSIFGPGLLEVTPAEDFEPTGSPGGPFTPPSKQYQLTNSGGSSIDWSVTKTADWLDLDSQSGSLDPCESTMVTVSLNATADTLGEGIYTDTLTFTDVTNNEEQTRGVTLSIGAIWIIPGIFNVDVIEGCTLTETMTIGNDGIEDFDFMIRTRQVGGSGESMVRIGRVSNAGGAGISSVPEDHDFTVPEDAAYKPGELMVRFAAKAKGNQLNTMEKNQILSSLGAGTVKHEYKIVPGLSLVELPAATSVKDALKTLRKASSIIYAEPNYEIKLLSTIPDDPRFDELWGMHNTGQTGGTADADIDAPEAWDIATGSHQVIAAVLDTGIDRGHVDLAANMWVNEAELNGTPGQDDDNNGYVDDIYGWDFADDDADPSDYHGHGTHCAGTVGAVGDNGTGVAGVCWDVKIMSLKVFPNYGEVGFIAGAIKAIEYGVDKGARVLSNSWGGGPYSQSLKDAIYAAGEVGVLFVASAGNDDSNNDVHPRYPSSYDCENIVAVMSTNDNDNKSSFSCYGPTSVDLGAPGSDILSCKPGDGYQTMSGTSMAAPHVAGACALLWSMNPVMSGAEVKDILLRTVDLTLPGLCVSEGRLNLYNAIFETGAPWIQIEPEEGTIGPGDSNDISVTFDAVELAPGTYEAEIVIISDDPQSPRIVPVTMTVNPDDLQVTPAESFESSGTEGGPFEPQCTTYTLTNTGAGPVNWITFEIEDWLEVDPCEGVLDPCESIDVNVCISPSANLLDPNIYTLILTFQNADSNSTNPRSITLTVKPPDCFTESFDESSTDLEGLMLTFMPDGTIAYYEACRDRITEFPTDPNGGTYVPLWDDDFVEVVLSSGAQILFYGQWYDRFYIGSNGYITFGEGDTEYSASLENHFNMPRISGLFADLTPPDDQCISYKQLEDRVVVTYEDVPLFGDKTATSSFQIEMFFADGTISVTWLDTAAAALVAGLSRGRGLPPVFFEESDLSEYVPCWPLGDFDRNYLVNSRDFAVLAAHWLDEDCNIPYWCGKTDLDYSRNTDWKDVGIFVENWLVEEDWWLQPVSYWKFDEGDGNTAYDSVGDNDGTVYGAQWATGQVGGALEFDGDGDYVDLGTQFNSLTAPFTVSLWEKTASTEQSGGVVMSLNVADDDSDYAFGIRGKFDQIYLGHSGNIVGLDDISSFLTDNLWQHWVVVFNSKDNIDFYLDGQDRTPEMTSVNSWYIAQEQNIGARADGTEFEFNGSIDDVRIYDRPLSAEEIWELFQEGLAGKAFNPKPADGASCVDPNTTLSWSPGKDALTHDVYFGTGYDDVNDANTADANVYMGNQDFNNWDPNNYDPNGLEYETTYYWRIDEVGPSNTHKGDVWSFTITVADPNFVSWWKFDEGGGDMAHDSVGDNDGTIYGAQWTTGQVGGALEFDGDGDYVLVPYTPTLAPTTQISFNLWAYSDDWTQYTSYMSVISKTQQGGYNLQSYEIPAGWAIQGIVRRNGEYARVSIPQSDLSVGWHYFSITYDGRYTKLYVDGILQDTDDAGSNYPIQYACSNPLIIGGEATCGSEPEPDGLFNGLIDDVRIYGRALSAEEIWQLYQEGLNQD